MVECKHEKRGQARGASGEAARDEGGAQAKKKWDTAIGSLIWRFAVFHASLFAVIDCSSIPLFRVLFAVNKQLVLDCLLTAVWFGT